MSDNKQQQSENPERIIVSLGGSTLVTCLCLLIILLLLLHLLSGCVPVDASIRNNGEDGSACVIWGSHGDVLPSCAKQPESVTSESSSSK